MDSDVSMSNEIKSPRGTIVQHPDTRQCLYKYYIVSHWVPRGVKDYDLVKLLLNIERKIKPIFWWKQNNNVLKDGMTYIVLVFNKHS